MIKKVRDCVSKKAKKKPAKKKPTGKKIIGKKATGKKTKPKRKPRGSAFLGINNGTGPPQKKNGSRPSS